MADHPDAIHDPFQYFLGTVTGIYSDSFQIMHVHRRSDLPTSSQGMWVRFYAWDLFSDPPREITLGQNGRVGSELRESSVHNVNKIHNWLLVAAYESLERFLKDMYAGIGWNDHSSWRPNDTRDIDLSSVDLLSIKSHVRRTIARHGANQIIDHMRNNLGLNDGVRHPDQHSLAYCSLRFWIGIAELVRHAIVHSESVISKTESEIRHLAGQKTSESFTGTNTSVLNNQRQLSRFLKKVDSNCFEVWTTNENALLEQEPAAETPFRFLMTGITSFAFLVYATVCDKFRMTPMTIGRSDTSTT